MTNDPFETKENRQSLILPGTTEIPLNQLVPNPRQTRTHSKRQIRKIAQSIRQFGFVNPVLIDASNEIIAGAGRVEAARQLGLTYVPTLRVEHLNDAEKRAYVLADNRLACLTSAPMGQFSAI